MSCFAWLDEFLHRLAAGRLDATPLSEAPRYRTAPWVAWPDGDADQLAVDGHGLDESRRDVVEGLDRIGLLIGVERLDEELGDVRGRPVVDDVADVESVEDRLASRNSRSSSGLLSSVVQAILAFCPLRHGAITSPAAAFVSTFLMHAGGESDVERLLLAARRSARPSAREGAAGTSGQGKRRVEMSPVVVMAFFPGYAVKAWSPFCCAGGEAGDEEPVHDNMTNSRTGASWTVEAAKGRPSRRHRRS